MKEFIIFWIVTQTVSVETGKITNDFGINTGTYYNTEIKRDTLSKCFTDFNEMTDFYVKLKAIKIELNYSSEYSWKKNAAIDSIWAKQKD